MSCSYWFKAASKTTAVIEPTIATGTPTAIAVTQASVPPRPIDQVQADIVATRAQHAAVKKQATDAATHVNDLKVAQNDIATKLRALKSEFISAAGIVETDVSNDIDEVEGFFERLIADI